MIRRSFVCMLAVLLIPFSLFAQAPAPERIAFREPCEGAPVLEFWEENRLVRIGVGG
jgi:hypothetical protein